MPSIERVFVGITFYALFHLFVFVVRLIEKRGMFDWRCFLHPVILLGACAFIILLALAVTSNRFSLKAMGYKRWKGLHRGVYVVEALVFFHIFLQSKILALVIFTPLLCIQLVRIGRKKTPDSL